MSSAPHEMGPRITICKVISGSNHLKLKSEERLQSCSANITVKVEAKRSEFLAMLRFSGRATYRLLIEGPNHNL